MAPMSNRVKGPREVFRDPPKISGITEGSQMNLCTVILLLGLSKYIFKEIFKNLTYDVRMTSLVKSMFNFRPPRDQTNYILFER